MPATRVSFVAHPAAWNVLANAGLVPAADGDTVAQLLRTMLRCVVSREIFDTNEVAVLRRVNIGSVTVDVNRGVAMAQVGLLPEVEVTLHVTSYLAQFHILLSDGVDAERVAKHLGFDLPGDREFGFYPPGSTYPVTSLLSEIKGVCLDRIE